MAKTTTNTANHRENIFFIKINTKTIKGKAVCKSSYCFDASDI